jgi:hypothetical protein
MVKYNPDRRMSRQLFTAKFAKTAKEEKTSIKIQLNCFLLCVPGDLRGEILLWEIVDLPYAPMW